MAKSRKGSKAKKKTGSWRKCGTPALFFAAAVVATSAGFFWQVRLLNNDGKLSALPRNPSPPHPSPNPRADLALAPLTAAPPNGLALAPVTAALPKDSAQAIRAWVRTPPNPPAPGCNKNNFLKDPVVPQLPVERVGAERHAAILQSIAPWQTRSEPPRMDGTEGYDLTEVMAHAYKYDQRCYPYMNVEQQPHWRTPCYLCMQGHKSKPWPVELGELKGRQLFADDFVVEWREGLERFHVEPEEEGKLVLSAKEKFECGRFFGFPGSAIHNKSHFLLFYEPCRSPSKLAMAVSKDGKKWTKLLADTKKLPWWGTGDMCILHDVHEPESKFRFKGVFNCGLHESHEWDWFKKHLSWDNLFKVTPDNPVCLATSPDGLSWTFQSPLGTAVGDTLSCLHHERRGGTYQLMLRKHYSSPSDWRDIRGTKIQELTEAEFRRLFLDPKTRDTAVPSKDPWKVISDWYFDAAHSKFEKYQRQIYAHSRTRDPSGLYWGFTHVVEYVIPPKTLDHGTFDQKNPQIKELFHKHEKYLQGVYGVDGIVPYLSTSRDGLHFDFWAVYDRRPLPLRPPSGTLMLQPAAQMLTPGDGRHHLFYSATPQAHATRWSISMDKTYSQYEKIYVVHFKEGRILGLRSLDRPPGDSRGASAGSARLRTKPFAWPKHALELCVDAVLPEGGFLTVRALPHPGSGGACWSAALGPGPEPRRVIADTPLGSRCEEGMKDNIKFQLEFNFTRGPAQLYSFTIGESSPAKAGGAPGAFRIQVPGWLGLPG